MRILLYVTIFALSVAPGFGMAQEPAADIAVDLDALVAECESCHGPKGVSDQDDIPTLAGQDAEKLLASLEQFYYYERHCPTTTYRHGDKPKTPLNMCNIAGSLGDEEKQALVDYFARQ